MLYGTDVTTKEEVSMDEKRVIIIGGHGKIALLAAPKLVGAGFAVNSVIRNPDQAEDVAEAGATPVILDIESADVDALAALFSGAYAVVFSAGAGGGNPDRTNAVDYEAAVRTMDAAERAGVSRYVMVSYARSETDIHSLDPKDSFYPYAAAKHHADNHLRGTGLEWTILGPGKLTLEPATRRVTVLPAEEISRKMAERGPEAADTSRENVAEVLVHVLSTEAAIRRTVNFFDGEEPLKEAVR